MPAHRTPRWTAAELAALHACYPAGGVSAAHAALPARSVYAIHVKAHKLGLKCVRIYAAPRTKLQGAGLELAIRLREVQQWSFARIGARFGLSEAGTCNAVLNALCRRRGFTPAQRDSAGHLTDQGRERLRLALKKGLKGVDIQLRLGISAGRVAEERRRYNRDLRVRGLALLPPPGQGEAYSGVKLTHQTKTEVEALFMQGLGTAKISAQLGVSKTSCTRIRTRLLRRLRKKGALLPGCDAAGVRRQTMASHAHLHPAQREALRDQILAGVPVLRAARHCAIGTCRAYQLRDELRAELATRGEQLPTPIRLGRRRKNHPALTEPVEVWPPQGHGAVFAFRALLYALGEGASLGAAKDQWRAERAADTPAPRQLALRPPAPPRTFEQQLALVASGKLGLAPAFAPRHAAPLLPEPGRGTIRRMVEGHAP